MKKTIISGLFSLVGAAMLIQGVYLVFSKDEYNLGLFIFGAMILGVATDIFLFRQTKITRQKIRLVSAVTGVLVGAGFIVTQVIELAFYLSPHLTFRFDWRFLVIGIILTGWGLFCGHRFQQHRLETPLD